MNWYLQYFWRLGKDGLVYNYPVAIDRFWYGLPWNLTHIDAIYEKKTGHREIIIFIGMPIIAVSCRYALIADHHHFFVDCFEFLLLL